MLCLPIKSLVGMHLLYGGHIIVDGVLKLFNEVIVYGWHISMDCVTMRA
jgi:hypothetical protein